MSNSKSINNAAFAHEGCDDGLSSDPLTQEVVVEGGIESDV
jgi:hypothetical protein